MAEVTVLNTIKKSLGIEADYTEFDQEITMHINSVLATLNQLGVIPDPGVALTAGTETWSTVTTNKLLNNVQSYIYLRVRLLWDPPTTSFAIESFGKQIQELEWRMNVQVEGASA